MTYLSETSPSPVVTKVPWAVLPGPKSTADKSWQSASGSMPTSVDRIQILGKMLRPYYSDSSGLMAGVMHPVCFRYVSVMLVRLKVSFEENFRAAWSGLDLVASGLDLVGDCLFITKKVTAVTYPQTAPPPPPRLPYRWAHLSSGSAPALLRHIWALHTKNLGFCIKI